ncbi:MAG: glycerol-3-phosphate 1-O-acyltransferase PlsY [Acidimicrobiia bacterium]|nr:MAG: glycerol-3-phosphate 1-O-acyltransferase PlsY [Acidimicrobiia bacterium]
MSPWTIAAVVGGYLLGSIDFGVILPRVRGVDIYASGSGNPGATNVLRTMGRGAATTVMLGDLGKGIAAAAMGGTAGGDPAAIAAGFAAVLGHCFPVWHRFRGGKGVAATAGTVLWVEPLVGLILFAVWAAIVAVTKRASLASIAVAAALVPGLWVVGQRGWTLAWATLIAVLVVTRHRANIDRLLRNAEHRIEP